MIVIQTWVLATLGAFVAVAAAIVGEVIADRLSSQADEADERVKAAEAGIESCQRHETMAREKFSHAQTLLAIVKSRQSFDPFLPDLGEIANIILGGIVDRNSAATGSHPTEEHMAKWVSITNHAAAGDASAFAELSKISAELLSRQVDYNTTQVAARNVARRKRRSLERRAERTRYIAVTLELLGILVVLMKDTIGKGA
jgi:hypothetical protein